MSKESGKKDGKMDPIKKGNLILGVIKIVIIVAVLGYIASVSAGAKSQNTAKEYIPMEISEVNQG